MGRGFTDPARSLDDLAALARIRSSLVARVRSGLADGAWTGGGESHWLVVPELRALVQSRPAFGVGFFGQAREHVDHGPILDLEHDLVARASRFPGLLAYYNVRFADGQWGNLVLFAARDDAERVRSDPGVPQHVGTRRARIARKHWGFGHCAACASCVYTHSQR